MGASEQKQVPRTGLERVEARGVAARGWRPRENLPVFPAGICSLKSRDVSSKAKGERIPPTAWPLKPLLSPVLGVSRLLSRPGEN